MILHLLFLDGTSYLLKITLKMINDCSVLTLNQFKTKDRVSLVTVFIISVEINCARLNHTV